MKNRHEEFTKFFESPSREKFRELIQFNTGEYDNLDFKKDWPKTEKLAKHILAFSNSSGGVIVAGVEESENKVLNPVGVTKIIDKSILKTRLNSFLPADLEYLIMDFPYTTADYGALAGKAFQVIFIEDSPNYMPFLSTKEGAGISANTVYVREGTSSVVANYDQLQKVLNRKISTSYNSSSELKLEEHLEHLRLLYSKINKYKSFFNFQPLGVENSNYPEEDFESFIIKQIHKKKEIIDRLIVK
ncbi:MAG: helix-turn-helix domain-containing protein [Alkaliphilus sp.]